MEHKEHIVGHDELILQESDLDMEIIVSPEFTGELAAIEEELKVTPLSPLELQIAEEKLNNIAPRAIAKRLGVSDKVVRIVLARHHVKVYIKDVFDSVTAADKDMRMQLMAAMIEEKMATEGISSKLDLAQLVQIIDSMGKVKEQADTGSQGSVMINILNNIRKD